MRTGHSGLRLRFRGVYLEKESCLVAAGEKCTANISLPSRQEAPQITRFSLLYSMAATGSLLQPKWQQRMSVVYGSMHVGGIVISSL